VGVGAESDTALGNLTAVGESSVHYRHVDCGRCDRAGSTSNRLWLNTTRSASLLGWIDPSLGRHASRAAVQNADTIAGKAVSLLSG
jgi:hypothetical protein